MSRIKSNQISSAIPEVNIVPVDSSKFESSIGSWVTYADAAGTQPVDGTGGSASITLSRTTVTSEVLNGSASLKIAKGATNRQGDGASLDITVPNYLKGQPCKISFSAKASANFDFGTPFSSNDPSDITVYLYDVTNSKLLQPYPYTIMSNMGYEGTFQIPSDCSSLRLILHVTTTNASAYDLFVDDVSVALAQNVNTTAISDWQDFTPTGSWVTNTTYTGKYRRVGENMECQVLVSTSGAPTATSLSINLPSGLVIDTTKLAQGGSAYATYLSSVTVGDSGSSLYGPGEVTLNTTTSVYLRVSNAGGTWAQPSAVSNTVPITFGAGDTVNAHFTVPIVGWTSSQTTAASLNLNAPVVMRAYKNGGSATAATTIASWTGVSIDSVGAFNSSTGVYTVKVPGDYSVNLMARGTVAGGGDARIKINGSVYKRAANGEGPNQACYGVIGIVPNLKVGDTIECDISVTKTLGSTDYDTTLEIYKIQSASSVYATRVAYLKDVKAANTGGGASTGYTSFAARELNTLEGDQSFISLSSNQFTLQPGTYHIEASAPAWGIGVHKIKLRNTTDSSDTIIGRSAYAAGADNVENESTLKGVFSITSAKTFEIQHICGSGSVSTSSLGFPSNKTVSEVYTMVKIEKVL